MKRLISIILLLSVILSLHPLTALSEGIALPDPMLSTGWTENVTFDRTEKHGNFNASFYTVQGDVADTYALGYVRSLLTLEGLTFSFKTLDYGDHSGTFYCFYSTKTANIISFEGVTDGACVVLYYDHGGNYSAHNIVLYYNSAFTLSTQTAGAPAIMPKAASQISSPAQATATPQPAASITNTLPRIQDPLSFFGEELTHWSGTRKSEKGFWIDFTAKSYSVGDALFNVYSEYLLQLGFTLAASIETRWGDIYYCYDAPAGYSLGTYPYSFTDVKGKGRSISPAVFICHEPGAMHMKFAFAPGLEVTDLGLRLDATLQQNLGEIGYKERREYIRNIMEEAAEARGESPASSGSSSSSSTSYSNPQKRYKNCPAVRCNGGKVPCSRCNGEGGKWVTKSTPNYSGNTGGSKTARSWESCSKCHGGKTQDCSTCDGRGKVEY